MPDFATGRWTTFTDSQDDSETRCMSGEHSLYDSKVLGKTTCNDSVEDPAVCLAYSANKDVALAVDESLTVVESQGRISRLNFDAPIDALCFCADVKMVLLVDAYGKLHMVSMNTSQVILSHQVANATQGNLKCCCAIICEEDELNQGVFHIAVGLTKSKITLFTDVQLQLLEKAHVIEDMNIMKDVQMSMKITEVDTSFVHGGVMKNMAGCLSSMRLITWGDGVLACWEASTDLIVTNQDLSLTLEGKSAHFRLVNEKKVDVVKIVPHFDNVFCLMDEGSLCLFHIPSMILVQFWHQVGIKDFMMMDSVVGDTTRNKLCAVVADESNGELHLCLYGMPSFTAIFKTSTAPSFCKLALGLSPPEDVIYADMNIIKNERREIRLVMLNNASPEDRFLRLLKKRQYEEAEQFAQMFKLNPQKAYHQKALHLAQVVMDGEEENISQLFENLKNCLEKMDDRDAVAKICLYTEVLDLRMSYSLLILGKSRLGGRIHVGNGDGNEANKCERNDLLRNIIERLDRLVTFNMAFGVNRYQDWIRFSHSNLSEELSALITKGDLYAAETIMKRHQASVVDSLEGNQNESEVTERRLQTLLECIPHSVDVDAIVRWLDAVLLPALLARIRCSVKVMASWLHIRAEAYESSHARDWPENGLKMANVLFNFQKNHSTGNKQLAAACQEFRCNSIEVEKLRLLVARLENLWNLKKKFNCHVSLAEFVQETAKSLTFRMLDRVMVPELIPSVLKNTVLPYMNENNFSEEDILLGYIEKSVSRMNDDDSRYFESLLERRIIAIINCLDDPQVAVTAAAKIAHHASIPWSQNMHSLVDKAIDIAKSQKDSDDTDVVNKMTRLIDVLQNCRYLENMPVILSQYGLKNVDPRKSTVQQQIVRYLIRQGTTEALNHADIFCRTFTTLTRADFHRYRLLDILHTGKFDKCIQLLVEVEKESKEIAVALVRHMLIITEIRLENNNDEDRIHYCSSSVAMAEHILPKLAVADREELNEKLKVLRNISALQIRCGEVLSVESYSDKASRTTLLAKKLEEYSSQGAADMMTREKNDAFTSLASIQCYQESSQDKILGEQSLVEVQKQTPVTNTGKLLEMASLLGVDRDRVRLWLAHNLVKSGQKGIKASLQICRELLQTSVDEGTANTSLTIVMDAIKLLDSNSISLTSDIFGVVVEAIMFCTPSNIGVGIEMCYLYKFASNFNKLMDDAHQHVIAEPGIQNQFHDFQALYPWIEEDDGLLLQHCDVSPVFIHFTSVLFNEFPANQDHGVIEAYFAKLKQSVLALTTILQHAGRPYLAFSWTVNCFGIALGRLANLADDSRAMLVVLGDSIEQLASVLPECVKDCIKKTLHGENIDPSLLAGLLALLPITQVQTLLVSELELAGNSSKRIMSIATAGGQILMLNSMEAEVHNLEQLFIDAHWSEVFKSLQIPFDRSLVLEQSGKVKTLRTLLHHPNSTGEMIKEFCIDYDLEVQSFLLEFLRILLADPSCIVLETDEPRSEDRSLISLNTMPASVVNMQYVHWDDAATSEEETDSESIRSWESINKEAEFVLKNVKDKPQLCRRLVHVLRSETSPYSYERAETLLTLIGKSDQSQSHVDVIKGLELIRCLSLVRRTARMGEHERDHWSYPGMSRTLAKLPKISNERLPLHPFLFGNSSSVWKILNPESNEQTAPGLVMIAEVLSLKVDKLYVSAVDNYISKHMDKDDHMRLLINKKQMVTLQRLSSQIGDSILANAVAKRIADLLPISEQKVEAYNWSAEIAQNWHRKVSDVEMQERVANTHRKLVELSNDVSMQLILQKHDLLSKSTSMLTSSPIKLIRFLYQHPSIVARYYKPNDESYPDILAATAAIAEFHSLNIFKMHLKLATEFLSTAVTNVPNADKDLVTKLTQAPFDDQDPEENSSPGTEVIRVLYILRNMEPKQTAKALLKFVSDKKNPLLTHRIRVQTLRCILQLFNDAIIEELTRQDISSFRKRVRLTVYLSELESIGFEIDGPRLESSKKEEIARSILAIHKLRRNPRAICMAAELCREFNAWCPSTWQMLLQQLVMLKQIRYLRDLLPAICSQPTIASLPCLATVWQSCVSYPFAGMTSPLTEEEEYVAVASYDFLLACPVLLEMDLSSIVKSFCDVNFPLLALGCLMICPTYGNTWKDLVTDQYNTIQTQLKKYPSILGHQRISEALEQRISEALDVKNSGETVRLA